MQLIRPVPVTAEQYVQENFHQQIRAPENCPNCQHAHSLEALCYYWRYVTSMLAAVLRIQVRRFLCRHCRVSVSCLPDFAQPYRLVNSSTVQGGFDGQKARPDVQRWGLLLGSYWKSFERHLPQLIRSVGSAFGPSFAAPSASTVLGANQKSVWQSSHCHTPIGEPVPHLFVWNLSLSPTQILSGSLRLSSLKNQDEGHPHTPNLLSDALGADSLARVCKITHPRQNWPWADTPP